MKIVVIGAGGHARVVYEILKHDYNMEIVGFVDNVKRGAEESIMGVPVVGDHSVLPQLIKQGVKGYVIGIGDNAIREHHFNEMKKLGLDPVNAIHPKTHISGNTKIGKGVVIVAGATIGTGVEIGDNVLINTGAIVEHENIVEDHVHIASGTVLAGRVRVKKGAFIGAGSVVKEYTTIGENSIVGAGSVVLSDVPDNVVAVGSPAKVIKNRSPESEKNGK